MFFDQELLYTVQQKYVFKRRSNFNYQAFQKIKKLCFFAQFQMMILRRVHISLFLEKKIFDETCKHKKKIWKKNHSFRDAPKKSITRPTVYNMMIIIIPYTTT